MKAKKQQISDLPKGVGEKSKANQNYYTNSFNQNFNSLKLQAQQASAPNYATNKLDEHSDQDTFGIDQDATQVMSKIDENRYKRAEIENFLSVK